MKIRYIQHSEIDFDRYDACVRQSLQYRYSATSIFLNATAGKNWAILVKGNYETVMPVPFIKKWGTKIVVLPKLCQQLGVFSKQDCPKENQAFLNTLQKQCIIWYYAFNQDNDLKKINEKRQNFILKNENYQTVFQKYSPKRKRKLRLEEEVQNNSSCQEITFQKAQNFIQKYVLGQKNTNDTKKYLQTISALQNTGKMHYYAFIYHGEIINLIALYVEQTTVALLGTYNIKEKIKLNGSSKITDFAISQWIDTHDFDFEGTNIPAVEEFFRGFRPKLFLYPYIHFSKWQIFKQFLKKMI